MTRKITTILLALALCLTLLPVGAGAAGTPSPSGVELKMDGTTLKYGNGTQYYDLDTAPYSYYGTPNACYVLNGGTYYLDSDVTIDKPLLIKGTATLDLKGHVLEYSNSATNGSVIIVNDGAHFTLQDTFDSSKPEFTRKLKSKEVQQTNEHISTTWSADINVIDDSGTAGTVTGGVITGGTGIAWLKQVWDDGTASFLPRPTYTGGGVFVGSDATFKMTGGNIVGCTATQNGGGVALCSGTGGNETTFTMTGGRIVGCTALLGGGVQTGAQISGKAVFGSIFTLAGGTIQDCTAGQSGGGVYAEGEFIMSGNSTIEKCTAISDGGFGGGVATGSNTIAEFTMKGGTITDCTAGDSGGGVHHQGGTFTMKGGTITDCTAEQKGGGVYINGSSKPAMDAQGGSVYGGVYIYGVVGTTPSSSMYGKLTNTSAEGSTIFYPDTTGETITKGNTGKIEGKRVTFMNGDDTYAETLAGVSESGSGIQIIYTPLTNAKISEPENPTKDGKTFLGWVTADPASTTHCKKFDFTKDTVTTDLTLYAAWDSDFEVEVSDAQNNTDGYYRTFTDAWSGASGDSPTFKLLKNVSVNGSLSYSRAGATLDLNGHEFSGNIAINGMLSNRGYQLTLTSSADNGNFNGTVTAAGNLAQLKVTGGTVNKVVVGNGGTLDCIGGKIKNLDNDGGTVNHTGGGTLHYDGSNHWKICTVCGNKCDNAAHTGGTATCKDKAICTACGTPYGSTTPNNHAGTLGSYQHDKDGHWQVYSCCNTKINEGEHSFGSDGKCVCGYEKPRRVYRGGGAPSISAVLSHPDAASATNYTSGIYGLTFRSTASFASFRGVQVDGKTIASSNYIAEEGSIVVYLKAVYLQTLPNGTHTVTILSTEGNATMDFTIGAVQSAKTGDAGVAIYALMALTSYTGTALVVRGRKRK